MPHTTTEAKADTLTFRIPTALKADLAVLAAKNEKPIGEFLRDLIQERLKAERRREFEAEAQRACAVINAAAQDPDSDEAQILRELDANFDEMASEWKWEE